MKLHLPLICALFALSLPLRPAEAEFAPYRINWQDNDGSPVDLSFLLDAPAGQAGFITAKDGHLVKPGGERFRIWGVNTTFLASTPTKKLAPVVAEHLARFGINCVRIHHLDWQNPRGIIDAARDDTRHFVPELVDRFDYFISELKKRGIYVNINLNNGRTYKKGDGVKDYELLGFAKALTHFDPRLIGLQKEYARKLLTHVNPYTGKSYAEEPAVAMVEIVNENSLFDSWTQGRLLGEQTTPPADLTWLDIPPSYERDLTRLYNDWLHTELTTEQLEGIRKEAGAGSGELIPRLTPDQFAGASDFRFRTEASFYLHVENEFYAEMERYLKDELGVKALLIGSRASRYPNLAAVSKLDIVDSHTYWQHPSYHRDPKTGEQTGWSIRNTPMVNDPFQSTVMTTSRFKMAGKPFTVSEVNHPFPAEYASEGIPVLAAYASFQDYDGVFWFSFAGRDPAEWRDEILSYFRLRQEPVKMTQLAAGALAFLRGDIQQAKKTVRRTYSREQMLDSLKLPRSTYPYYTPGLPLELPLIHGMSVASLNGPPPGEFAGSSADPIVSDTRELFWYKGGNGLVAVNTPRTQGLIGFVNAHAHELENVSARVDNQFCAITLTSLEQAPIARAGRLLLNTGARVAMTGMKWNEDHTTLVDRGKPPVVIEKVTGELTLRNLEGARGVEALPLDGAGKPFAKPIKGTRGSGGWKIALGDAATPWYLIEVRR